MGTSQPDLGNLRALSEGLADAIKARVATVNRADRGSIANPVLSESMKEIAKATEDKYRELLLEEYRRVVPAGVQDWVTTVPGMASGELFPRLLGAIGNPRIATPYHWEVDEETGKRALIADAPYIRGSGKAPNPSYGDDAVAHYGLRSLWQYCGCGDPDSRPKKGATQEELLRAGKLTQVRPILHTFSTYLVKSRNRSEVVHDSHFLAVYDAAREAAEAKVHTKQCQNTKRPPMHSNGCGIVAHPEWGAPGSKWRPGHMAAHAHRMVAKEFLRQLYAIWPDPEGVA
jgi:hypothetical protein